MQDGAKQLAQFHVHCSTTPARPLRATQVLRGAPPAVDDGLLQQPQKARSAGAAAVLVPAVWSGGA
jgi:hypothetical protein